MAADETYRVALLRAEDTDTSSPHSQSNETGERKPPELATDDPPVEEGEIVDVTIESIGEKGDGIAKVGPGYVVIVPDTEIDEQVTARISEVKDNIAFAEVVERHAPEP